ncbi:MAG: hemagglutinin repeat-containing protein [Rhodocyclaceae bacterium]
MQYDPKLVTKRLGDGFYEQTLVRQQVSQLTGQRFLANYSNDEEQYRALLGNGATFAQQHGLVPGVALSAEQMALLTSDIVWLVEQRVSMRDGTSATVLVPQVYARVKPGDIDGSGALFAARDVQLNIKNEIANSGTLAARNYFGAAAEDIKQSGGRINASIVDLKARNDIKHEGGLIGADKAVSLDATRNVTIASQTATASNGQGSNTAVSRVARVQVGAKGAQGEAESSALIIRAGNDIKLAGASINNAGKTGLTQLIAGNDIDINTVTVSSERKFGALGDRNHLQDRTSAELGSAITGDGNIVLNAKNDLNARGATVMAKGAIAAHAGHDVNITGSQSSYSVDTASHGLSRGLLSKGSVSTHYVADDTYVNSSRFSAGTSLSVTSDHDVNVMASALSAGDTAVVRAKNDVRIGTQTETHRTADDYRESKSGITLNIMTGVNDSSKRLAQQGSSAATKQIGSSVTGKNVYVDAGRDAVLTASNLIGDEDAGVWAGRHVELKAAYEDTRLTSASQSKSSNKNILGGIAPRQTFYGKSSADEAGRQSGTHAVTTIISANKGRVTVRAGTDPQYADQKQGHLLTEGANIQGGEGVSLRAQALKLGAVHSDTASAYTSHSRSFAVGASLAGSIGGVITSIYDNVEAARNTDNDRLKGALALKAGYDAYKLRGAGTGSAPVVTDAMVGTDNIKAADVNNGRADPSSGSAFGISVSITSSNSKSNSNTASSTARGTNIQGRDIDIKASEGDIDAVGAKIQGRDVALDAKGKIYLGAASNTEDVHSTNKGGSAGVGVTFGVGQQNGFSIQLGASQTKGRANGSAVTHDNTVIDASNRFTLKSGGDTTLDGAQVTAKTIRTDIKGALNITTRQDLSQYESKQSSSGFQISLCIPPICYGQMASGSVSYAKSNINHNYQSATGQSGFFVSDAYDIKVAGGTHLAGGAIVTKGDLADSTFSTASISYEDLNNHQSSKVSSTSISAGYGGGSAMGTLASNAAANILGNAGKLDNGLLASKGSGKQSGTTQSVVVGNIQLTGTGNEEIDAQSRQNADVLTSRDPDTANGALTKSLALADAQKLHKELQTQQDNARAAAYVGQVTTNALGDVAQARGWGEGSWQKTTLHGMAGVLQAAVAGGNLGAGLVAGASNELLVGQMADYIKQQNPDISKADFDALMKAGSSMVGLAAAAIVSGGDARDTALGANVALVATTNNYLKHQEISELSSAKRACSAGGQQACGEQKRLENLSAERDAKLESCRGNSSSECNQARQEVRSAFAEIMRSGGVGLGSVDYLNYQEESRRTGNEAKHTLSSWGYAKGKAVGFANRVIGDPAKTFLSLAENLGLADAAHAGDVAAQNRLDKKGQAFGGLIAALSNPDVWGQMPQGMRNKIADAYENGDAYALGRMDGEVLGFIATLPSTGGAFAATTKGVKVGENIAKLGKAANSTAEGVQATPGIAGKVNHADAIADDGAKVATKLGLGTEADALHRIGQNATGPALAANRGRTIPLPGEPAFVGPLRPGIDRVFNPADFPDVAASISQKQMRHIAGRPELTARGGGGYLNSLDDAQAVLDAYRSGTAPILGRTSQGFPVVKMESIVGTNVNVGAGIKSQPTSVFMIKGTASPSVVPLNPNWKP